VPELITESQQRVCRRLGIVELTDAEVLPHSPEVVSVASRQEAYPEYGRIDEALHLLRAVDPVDGTYRRQMNRQLTCRSSVTSRCRAATASAPPPGRRRPAALCGPASRDSDEDEEG
jgi:hypothetical protein